MLSTRTLRTVGPTRHRLGALRSPGYRYFLGAQSVGSIGTWMQSVVQIWLVLQLTHSGVLLGLVVTAQNLPILVAGPFGGLVADRFRRRCVLVVTQALFAVLALGLLALISSGAVSYTVLVVSATLWGCVQVADLPTRQAAVTAFVGERDMLDAIALGAATWHAASIVGPSLAGVVIGLAGPAPSLLCSSACYLTAIALLLRTDDGRSVPRVESRLLLDVNEAAHYVRRNHVLTCLLLLVAIFSLCAMNRLTVVPLFADQVLRVGAPGFGLLMSISGLGALAGGLALALRTRPVAGSTHFWIGLVWVSTLIMFSATRRLWLSAVLLGLAGVAQEWFLVTALTRIQLLTADRLRGRVLAFYGQALTGVVPIGSFLAGEVASLFGPPVAIAAGAAIAGVAMVLARFLVRTAFATSPVRSVSITGA